MKRVAWLAAVVLATLMMVALLWEFRSAGILCVLSLGVAAAVRPAIDQLVKNGFPRSVALLITYGVSLSVIASLFFALSGTLVSEIQQLADSLASSYEHVTSTWPQGSAFQQAVSKQLPPPARLYDALTSGEGAPLATAALGLTSGLLDYGSNLIIVLALSIYWGTGHQQFERLWLSLLPVEVRARARDVWQAIESGVGSYVRSELVQGLLAGLLLGLGYWAMGLQYPALLAIWGALAWLIPWVGVLLAVVPVLLVGMSHDPLLGGLAALYTFCVLFVMEVWIEPRLFNRRRYSSMLIMLVVVALADAFGIIGIVAAPPVAAAIQIFFSRVFFRQQPVGITSSPAFRGSDFQDRLAALQVMVAGIQNTQPELINMVERLNKLIVDADPHLPGGIPITSITQTGSPGEEQVVAGSERA